MTASITADCKDELLASLQHLAQAHTCTKGSLLSLIGKLAFACKVVRPGRIFLPCLIDLGTCLHHHVTLNREAKADLNWWIAFLPTWPGTSLLLQNHWSLSPDMELATNASDFAYGTFWAGQFSLPWPPALRRHSIAWREMYAILIACTTWGPSWQLCWILFHCDYAAVVAVWKKGYCKCPKLMALVRDLTPALLIMP